MDYFFTSCNLGGGGGVRRRGCRDRGGGGRGGDLGRLGRVH